MTKESTYHCRILRVDLTTGRISKEELDPRELRKYIGGNGVAIKMLYDEVPPGVGPYDPENRLIFAAGPCNGTKVPGSGIVSVATKGTLNNLLSSAQANGFFGARMRFAGCEVIVIQGAATTWKYLWIHDGEAELCTADHLLGLDTWETEERLKEELAQTKASVACIGPSGENLVRFSGIFCDHGHVAASNGPGTVMGAKKLKAIAVYGQKAGMEIWAPDELNLVRKAFLGDAEQSWVGSAVKALGTLGTFPIMDSMGAVPIKNMTTNVSPELPAFYGENIRARFERKPRPCWACPWSHCSEMKVTEGPEAGYEGEEPEYEDMAAWGVNVGIHDPGTALKLSNLNDRMGMDVKECGFAVSLAIECYEKGIIGLKETGGLDLRWGNAAAIGQLIEDIAHRRGFGDVLAEGVMRAAARIGGEAPNFAVYIGRGFAPHIIDLRGMWSTMFGHTLSDTGSIEAGAQQDAEIGNTEPIGFHDVEGIPPGMAKAVGRWLVYDALGVCNFFLYGRLGPIVEIVRAVTGWDFTIQELLEAGQRIGTLARAFNVRHGLEPEKDNTVSPRLASAPVDGPAQGKSVGPVHRQMAQHYYREMGWDEKTSKPLRETLHRLGLDNVARDLWG